MTFATYHKILPVFSVINVPYLDNSAGKYMKIQCTLASPTLNGQKKKEKEKKEFLEGPSQRLDFTSFKMLWKIQN